MKQRERSDSLFSPTQWSVVLQARDLVSPGAHQALERLCQCYRPPVLAHLRRRGFSPHDAEDLAQSFFAQLLARPFLQNVGPERGRFRAFVLQSLQHFLINARDRARRQKRGGDSPPVALETIGAEHRDDPAAGWDCHEFDEAWAVAIVNQAFTRLQQECREAGKSSLFDELQRYLLQGDEPTQAPEIAFRLGLEAAAVRQVRCRLRQRFRELLTQTVAHTVEDPAQVEEEARYLISVLARRSSG